jgi:GNAT superfamily N-acetyltransferase
MVQRREFPWQGHWSFVSGVIVDGPAFSVGPTSAPHGRGASADGILGIMKVRPATPADLSAAVETITDAFHHDPVWSWAFPDPDRRPDQYRRWWAVFLRSALRYDGVMLADDAAAVAVWIPPGAVELTKDEEAGLEPLLREMVGPWSESVLEGLHRFDQAVPASPPHYYLTLLGTRSDRRGQGLGMALLRECLAGIDAEGVPAYLESSNPANNHRYQSVGFTDIGAFSMPDDGPSVTRMWRPAAR